MRCVFLAPHHDDETLFGAFTLIGEQPLVVVVYDGGPEREAETNAAMRILGCEVEHWRIPVDGQPLTVTDIRERVEVDAVYAPLAENDGQPQHNLIGELAIGLDAHVIPYLTYTAAGKSTDGIPVPYEPGWVALKLAALACYPSQSGHPSHAPHFIRDQTEYTAWPF